MKRAIYPGSFNPWHDGHGDVLKKALKVFDQVIIAVGMNPYKSMDNAKALASIPEEFHDDKRIAIVPFDDMLPDFVKRMNGTAVIRGLRDGRDLDAEKAQQYWYEDLKLEVPVVFFITDRSLVHLSSSAIRAVALSRKNQVKED